MKNANEEVLLNQEFYSAEYINEEGNYVKTKYRKVEQWAFYLRFIGKWFVPCEKDQAKLKDLFLNAELHLAFDTAKITFMQNVSDDLTKISYTFAFPFVRTLPFFEFKPCVKCQKQLRQLVVDSTKLTIGNKDYQYPVELQRKNETDDDSYETVEEHKATAEEKKRIGDEWIYENLSKVEYDALPIIK